MFGRVSWGSFKTEGGVGAVVLIVATQVGCDVLKLLHLLSGEKAGSRAGNGDQWHQEPPGSAGWHQ